MKQHVAGFAASVTVLLLLAGCGGCSLNTQVPKAAISFNPQTKQIEIVSHKDVVLSNVVAQFQGTNATISIGYYAAHANVAVIQEALKAQKQQIEGWNNGLERIVGAAIQNAK